MRQSFDPVRQPWLRRLVLGGAVLLACAVVLPRTTASVDAAPVVVVAQAAAAAPADPAPAAGAKPDAGKGDSARSKAAKSAAKSDEGKAEDSPSTEAGADERDRPGSEVTIDHRGITVHKGSKRVNVQAFFTGQQYLYELVKELAGGASPRGH